MGNLDHDDDGARRELNYLANLLEERLHYMRGEEATSTIEPLSSSLFSAHKEQVPKWGVPLDMHHDLPYYSVDRWVEKRITIHCLFLFAP